MDVSVYGCCRYVDVIFPSGSLVYLFWKNVCVCMYTREYVCVIDISNWSEVYCGQRCV